MIRTTYVYGNDALVQTAIVRGWNSPDAWGGRRRDLGRDVENERTPVK
jgi:hypothetical protein